MAGFGICFFVEFLWSFEVVIAELSRLEGDGEGGLVD